MGRLAQTLGPMNTALPQHARYSSAAYRVALVLQGHAAFGPALAGFQCLQLHPARSPQARACLVGLGVCNAPPVAHRLGCAPHRPIKHAVRVRRAIGTGAVHFQRHTVVVVPGHRPAGCRHAHKVDPSPQANPELPPTRRFVVPVVAGNELARFPQRHRHNMGPNPAVKRSAHGGQRRGVFQQCRRRGHPLTSTLGGAGSIVVAQLSKKQCITLNPIYHAMFVSNSARPEPGQRMFQWLRLT